VFVCFCVFLCVFSTLDLTTMVLLSGLMGKIMVMAESPPPTVTSTNTAYLLTLHKQQSHTSTEGIQYTSDVLVVFFDCTCFLTALH